MATSHQSQNLQHWHYWDWVHLASRHEYGTSDASPDSNSSQVFQEKAQGQLDFALFDLSGSTVFQVPPEERNWVASIVEDHRNPLNWLTTLKGGLHARGKIPQVVQF